MAGGFIENRFRLSNTRDWGANWSNPFMLPSSSDFPTEIKTAFDYAYYLYTLVPTYRGAARKTSAYFVTKLEYAAKNRSGENTWMREFMEDSLLIRNHCMEKGEEYFALGNSITWIYFPFDRQLVDTRNGRLKEHALGSFPEDLVKFSLSKMQYQVPDPQFDHLPPAKRPKVWMSPYDRQSADLSRICLRKLDPRRMSIHRHDLSGKSWYVWHIMEEQWFKYLTDGNLFWVNDTPLAILEAARQGMDFVFDRDQVFHMAMSNLSGTTVNAGWGVPEPIALFRDFHQVQIYRRIDEALALDYMLPMRILSPNISGMKGGDVATDVNMGVLRDAIASMFQTHKNDPFGMYGLPFPVTWQEPNSSGKSLVSKDLMMDAENRLLNNAGFPAELWRGSMNTEQMIPTLRIFENSHWPLASGLNRFIQWAGNRINQYLTQDIPVPRLAPPSVVSDLDRRALILQLASSGEISRAVAFDFLGDHDPVTMALDRTKEDLAIETGRENLLRKHELEKSRGTLSDAVGGAAGAAPPGANMSPVDKANEAQQIASEWAGMSESDRRKAMEAMKAQRSDMYAMAKQKLEEMRAQGASEGARAVTAP